MAPKRNAGEGSIFERSDGRWCAQLDLGWQNGRRVRKYIHGATAGEVQEALLKVRKLMLVESKPSRSRRTLSLPGLAVKALKMHKVRQLYWSSFASVY
jgi:hypothetical protein